MALSARVRTAIDIERTWWKLSGSKDAQIRARFDGSPSSYYRTLQSALDDPDALAYDPLTIRRLRRQRDQRRRVRHEGRRADRGRR